MQATTTHAASCLCGQVRLEAIGAPILSTACYCESCRKAAGQFEQAPEAPSVFDADGAVDYCLFRKDRVVIARGGEHLREHRLKDTSPTRRMVAACCNAPMFLDFTGGHWLTLYRDRLAPPAPPLEAAVMGKDRPERGTSRSDGLSVHASYPATFMIRLLASWVAMGFRRPKVVW